MMLAIASALVHFIWQGTLIAALLFAVLRAFDSPRVRYAAGCLAMLAALASFATTLVLLLPKDSGLIAGSTAPNGFLWIVPPARASADLTMPRNWLSWLAPIWLAGVSLFTLRSAASWFAAIRLCRRGVVAASGVWRARLTQLAAEIGVTRSVELLESALLDTPATLGWLRPVILMPAGLLAGLPSEQIEYFLVHELAHIRRRDYLVNVLQCVTEDLLFFHPAIWWISAVIRTEREHCADDIAAAWGEAPRLAGALVALEQFRTRAPQPALAAQGGHLMNRIHRLLGKPASPRGGALPAFIASAAVLSVTFLLAQEPQPPNRARDAARAEARQVTLEFLIAQTRMLNEQAAKISEQAGLRTQQADQLSQQARELSEQAAQISQKAERLLQQARQISQQSAQAAQPAQPSPAAQPKQAQPVQPPQPAQQPVQPAQPANQVERAQPAQPAQAAQPALQPEPAPQAAPAARDPYQKWMEEEVVYIISDAERSAFLRLRTDEERQMFIMQFWLRRDPTPGTPQNEMQEEHYRRIGYANDRFTWSMAPGWRTDRGQMYIRFGPPDEKESGGGTPPNPRSERWRYRLIQGVGTNVDVEFLDNTGAGEYRMSKDPAAR